jgi:hypothetical protein
MGEVRGGERLAEGGCGVARAGVETCQGDWGGLAGFDGRTGARHGPWRATRTGSAAEDADDPAVAAGRKPCCNRETAGFTVLTHSDWTLETRLRHSRT